MSGWSIRWAQRIPSRRIQLSSRLSADQAAAALSTGLITMREARRLPRAGRFSAPFVIGKVRPGRVRLTSGKIYFHRAGDGGPVLTDSAVLNGTLRATPTGSELVGTLRLRPTTKPRLVVVGLWVLALVVLVVRGGTDWLAIPALTAFAALAFGVLTVTTKVGFPEHLDFLESWVSSRL